MTSESLFPTDFPHAESALLRHLGFDEPTPIQKAAIPLLAEGHSLHALAATGSGKTLSFLLPLFLRIDASVARTQMLVLVPTRELGLQISQVAEGVARALAGTGSPAPTVRTAFGGQKTDTQKIEIRKNPHVLVATPGRALDLMRNDILSLKGLGSVVLDEADLMLTMGFAPQVGALCGALPRNVQTALFSATESVLPGDLEERLVLGARRVDVRVAPSQGAKSDFARHEVLRFGDNDEKFRVLSRTLRAIEATTPSGILFCGTRENVGALGAYLRREGHSVEALSGELGQIQRTTVLRRFKAGGVRYLIATNIAARGIDVSDLGVVVNVDLPSTREEYVHRAGRTGRAGKSARVVNLCTTVGEGFLRRILIGEPVTLTRFVAPVEHAEGADHRDSDALGEADEAGTASLAGDQASPSAANSTSPRSPGKAVSVADAHTSPATAFRKIHLNRGKSDKIRPADILGALTKELGVRGSDVGGIFIFDHFTHVEVDENQAATLIEKLSRTRIKNMTVKASAAAS